LVSSPNILTQNLQFELHIQHAKVSAGLLRIVSLLDQKTGKASVKKLRLLTARQAAIVEAAIVFGVYSSGEAGEGGVRGGVLGPEGARPCVSAVAGEHHRGGPWAS
jgi:hypothetical protein